MDVNVARWKHLVDRVAANRSDKLILPFRLQQNERLHIRAVINCANLFLLNKTHAR